MVRSPRVSPRIAASASLGQRPRGESWCTTTRAIAGAVYLGRDFNRQTGKSSQRSRELKILRGKSGQVPFHDLL